MKNVKKYQKSRIDELNNGKTLFALTEEKSKKPPKTISKSEHDARGIVEVLKGNVERSNK
jgi:hypothetical protein